MAERVFLHVGTTKTGTTFLQRVLWSHKARLRRQGMLLPGRGIVDHFRACLDVRESPELVRDPGLVPGTWKRLVETMQGWSGDAVVSHELFAPASAEQAQRAIADLGGAEVHVVVTVRDLVRQVPAEWQEHLKHRSVLTFPEFVKQVRDDPEHGPFSPNGYYFWQEQDVVSLLERWGGSLPPERVHVVTVPPAGAGPSQLWDRFAGLLDIDATGFDLERGRSNSSVGAEQAELLRRLNLQLGDRLPLPGPYPPTVKGQLAHQHLAGRKGTAFGLVGEDREYAVRRAHDLVADLGRMGVAVVGDLEELLPAPEQAAVSGDAAVTPEAVLDEATEALAEMLSRLAAEREARLRLEGEVDALTKALDARAPAEDNPDVPATGAWRRRLREALRGLRR
jgi:hypothetical protein